MKYELEWLSGEFERHTKEEQSAEGFNLPIALKSMVDEVISLRQQVGELVDYIHGDINA